MNAESDLTARVRYGRLVFPYARQIDGVWYFLNLCMANCQIGPNVAIRVDTIAGMVRHGRRVVLAGASPVRVSAEAPGSRLQPEGEIRPSQAECQKPLKQRGASRRAATISERKSLVKSSAERCLGGPSRSFRGEGNRQHPGTERMLDLSGVAGGGTSEQSNAEQERPYPAASSGKDRAYKAGWLKSRGAGRESERSKVPMKACKTTRWREGTLL